MQTPVPVWIRACEKILQNVQSASKYYTRNYPIRPDIQALQSLPLSPFQPTGFSHYHKLSQSISVLKVVWWYFNIALASTLFRPRSDDALCGI